MTWLKNIFFCVFMCFYVFLPIFESLWLISLFLCFFFFVFSVFFPFFSKYFGGAWHFWMGINGHDVWVLRTWKHSETNCMNIKNVYLEFELLIRNVWRERCNYFPVRNPGENSGENPDRDLAILTDFSQGNFHIWRFVAQIDCGQDFLEDGHGSTRKQIVPT